MVVVVITILSEGVVLKSNKLINSTKPIKSIKSKYLTLTAIIDLPQPKPRGANEPEKLPNRGGENRTGKLLAPPLRFFDEGREAQKEQCREREREGERKRERKREECTTNPEERECAAESLDRVYCYTPFVFESR